MASSKPVEKILYDALRKIKMERERMKEIMSGKKQTLRRKRESFKEKTGCCIINLDTLV